MAATERVSLTEPPADVELGLPRDPLEYYVTYPDGGMRDDTGLIFWIPFWGEHPAGDYSALKLRPYLATKYDCLVVSVHYHGIQMKLPGPHIKLEMAPGWPEAMRERYGSPLTDNLGTILAHLASQGIDEVCPSLPMLVDMGVEYQSFGFLPALDHIAVLADVLNSYRIDRKRIILFGSSYGGYVAGLVFKFMQNTFSVVVENSGFSQVVRGELAPLETGARLWATADAGVRISLARKSPWTLTRETDPHYFRPGFERIRDLRVEEHYRTTETRLFGYHCVADEVTPLEDKEAYWRARGKTCRAHLTRVTERDIDGRMFKVLAHGMDASLRDLFDHAAARAGDLERDSDATDFERNTDAAFDCGDLTYHVRFRDDLSFAVDAAPTSSTEPRPPLVPG